VSLTRTQEQRNDSPGQLQEEAEMRPVSSRPALAVRPTSSRSRRQSSRGHSRKHSRSSSKSYRPGHQRTTSGVRSVVDEGQTGHTLNQHFTPPASGEDGFLHPNSSTSRPQSPAAAGTVIPPSKNGATTRPKHDGIAYPFKLKVDDEDGKHTSKNPSLVTLDSGDAMSARSGRTGGVDEALEKLNGVEASNKTGEKDERPGVERYYTAADHFG
jgi:hypothetical protein